MRNGQLYQVVCAEAVMYCYHVILYVRPLAGCVVELELVTL